MQFLWAPVTFPLLGQNILTPFSNTLYPYFSFSVTEKGPHQHEMSSYSIKCGEFLH
jgi:hypothetical protein